MRAALTLVVLALVTGVLVAILRAAETSRAVAHVARVAIGMLAGAAAAVVTVTLALDVIPDTREGDVLDMAVVVAAAGIAVILLVYLVAWRLR